MPTTYKVLGQSAPAAATNTTLYTVPASTSAVVSSVTVSNRSTTNNDYISIAIRPAGATLANQHYVAKDVGVGLAGSLTVTIGITLATTDVVTVYSEGGISSFTLLGSEIS